MESGPARRAAEGRWLKPGLRLLADQPGTGEALRRGDACRIRLRLWLRRGDPVRWQIPWGSVGQAHLEDDGATLVTRVRLDRSDLIAGIFYGLEGMRVGGMRRLEIAPHLGYGDRGVPGVIPAGALLTAELVLLAGPEPAASPPP